MLEISFASRALALARAEAPNLGAVQVIADGTIQGLDEIEPNIDPNQAGDGEAILIGGR